MHWCSVGEGRVLGCQVRDGKITRQIQELLRRSEKKARDDIQTTKQALKKAGDSSAKVAKAASSEAIPVSCQERGGLGSWEPAASAHNIVSMFICVIWRMWHDDWLLVAPKIPAAFCEALALYRCPNRPDASLVLVKAEGLVGQSVI